MIKGNPSGENPGSQRDFFYGISSFRVLGVNPTKEEIKQHTGIELKSEPQYSGIKSFNNSEWNKLSFLVQSMEEPSFTTRVEFLISGRASTSGQGKAEVINKYGQHTYVKDEADLADERFSWFRSGEGEFRQAYEGESKLIEFLKVWCNVPGGENPGEVFLENPEALFEKFNISEIQNIVKSYKDENYVDLLIGIVRGGDGKLYHKVYDKYYGRYKSDPMYFARKLTSGKSFDQFKAIYPDDLKFQQADPAVLVENLQPANSGSGSKTEATAPKGQSLFKSRKMGS